VDIYIYSVESGRRSNKPDLSVDVTRANGHWVFSNFIYSAGTDLLMILKLPEPKCTDPR
jgi:hypothetical protein